MSKTPNYDAKVKTILDALAPGEKVCEMTGEKWIMTEDEIGWDRRVNVPPSPYSLMTRWYLLCGITLGYEWWWNKHAETGKPILTYIHPASGVRVLPDLEWQQKDFSDISSSFDEQRPFFNQLLELRKKVPLPASLNAKEPQNSIASISQGDVNSYFMIACRSKNSFYSSDAFDVESSTELYTSSHVINSSQVIFAQRIHNCRTVSHSYDCANSAFLFDCRNCEFCFGGTNLRNRKYVLFNKQLTKEEYETAVAAIDLSCRSVFKEQLGKFHELMKREGFWPENFNEKAPQSTGEYLRNCTRMQNCFNCFEGPTDSSWCVWSYGKSERNYFCVGPLDGADDYFVSACLESSGCKLSMNLTRCQNVEYSANCTNCKNCFGCVGLSRKKFCILNRQYTEQDYWTELDRIKCLLLERGEYGRPFSGKFSTSYFYEGVAGQNLAATEAERTKYGFDLFDPESEGAIGELSGARTLRDSNEVPDCAEAVNVAEWAGVPLLDKSVNRRFAFLRPELEFYKQLKIAPPSEHFITRVKNLYQTANIFIMEDASCAKCGKQLRIAKNVTFKNRKHLCREDYLNFLESRG